MRELSKRELSKGTQLTAITRGNLKAVKKYIKEKIPLYEPLTGDQALRAFGKWLQATDSSTNPARDLPGSVKELLIENTYYALSENYIPRIVMDRLGITDPGEIRVWEAVDFIRHRLEKNRLAKLKQFREQSKFKTYLTTAVNRLFIDFWRHRGTAEDNVTRYGPEFEAIFEGVAADPLTGMIESETRELHQRGAELLPDILDTLPTDEKLAFKLKYSENTNINRIAATLGKSHYKTRQLVARAEEKIKRLLREKIEHINRKRRRQ